MTVKDAQQLAHRLIQGYIGPDHRVMDMQNFYRALVQALLKKKKKKKKKKKSTRSHRNYRVTLPARRPRFIRRSLRRALFCYSGPSVFALPWSSTSC